MADTIFKPKVQLRSTSITSNGSSNGGDKTPTTPSKLMINHGKPNFTIQRSPKIQQNGDNDPFTNVKAKDNNYNPYKTAGTQNYNNNNNVVVSTKFNGTFKPTNVPITQKQSHQSDDNDNEAAKVVLRRAKVPEPAIKDGDEAVPEFIRRQRRIQERLAKENILDFESRRSGYFTHVMISPTSPNRMSFGATMSSPPVVPALETLPAVTATSENAKTDVHHALPVVTNGDGTSNGHHSATDEEEVAKAIEEVNKAVEGEDDELKEEQNIEPTVVVAVETTLNLIPESTTEQKEQSDNSDKVSTSNGSTQSEKNTESNSDNLQELIETAVNFVANVDIGENNTEKVIDSGVEKNTTSAPQPNGHIEVVEVHASQENGHDDITISHTNGFDGPSIPAPDPSGALGVNYEPKTVVSFSKDLGSEPNKYPDTVKVSNQTDEVSSTPVDEKLQELSKLKFDIKADEQDVQVTPVLRTD